jgi:hypothetical protein
MTLPTVEYLDDNGNVVYEATVVQVPGTKDTYEITSPTGINDTMTLSEMREDDYLRVTE